MQRHHPSPFILQPSVHRRQRQAESGLQDAVAERIVVSRRSLWRTGGNDDIRGNKNDQVAAVLCPALAFEELANPRDVFEEQDSIVHLLIEGFFQTSDSHSVARVNLQGCLINAGGGHRKIIEYSKSRLNSFEAQDVGYGDRHIHKDGAVRHGFLAECSVGCRSADTRWCLFE